MIKNQFAEFLTRKQFDKRDIVRLTGLDNHTIDKIYKKQTNAITFNTLNKLCTALDCRIEDIFTYIPD